MFIRTAASFRQGARTLPRAYYTSEELFAAEKDAIFGRLWSCVGRSQPARAGRRLHRRRRRGRIDHCRARPGRNRSSLLQRLPASRHSPVHDRDGPVRRCHPVSVPRMDLCDRGRPDWRAAHARRGRIQSGRLSAPYCCRRRVERVRVRERRHRDDALRDLDCAARHAPRSIQSRNASDRPPRDVRRQGQLEARFSELFRMPPLPRDSSRACGSNPVSEFGERSC